MQVGCCQYAQILTLADARASTLKIMNILIVGVGNLLREDGAGERGERRRRAVSSRIAKRFASDCDGVRRRSGNAVERRGVEYRTSRAVSRRHRDVV